MSTTNRIPATFMSVNQFKNATNSSKLDVVFNKKTNRLSVLADETDFYKCQQSIDTKKPLAFLLPSKVVEKDGTERAGTIDDACLVNVSNESPLTIKATL